MDKIQEYATDAMNIPITKYEPTLTTQQKLFQLMSLELKEKGIDGLQDILDKYSVMGEATTRKLYKEKF